MKEESPGFILGECQTPAQGETGTVLIWLIVIDADEQGIRVWQLATKLPHEEK
jgi:hypothetical protein